MAHELTRPGWQQNKALNVLSGVAVVFFIATALYWARVIFIPVALAIYFAFILTPPVVYLQRKGLPRVVAVLLVVAGAVVAFAGVGLVVGQQIANLTRTLPEHRHNIETKIETVKTWVNANVVRDLYETLTEEPQNGGKSTVYVAPQPSWASWAQGVLSPAAAALGQAALTFVLLVFMLNRREDLRNRMIRLVGQGRITTATKAVDETSRRVSRYLLVQFLINATFGTIVTAGLLLLQVPYAPLWGFVGFLMRYVPYIGTWIAVIPPTVFTFAVSDTWGPPIMVFVLFIGLELLAGNVAEPLLFGHSLGLSEVAQLVAAAFWAFLWGPVGLILSGPLTVCLLILGKYVPQWRFLSVLLGDEPVLSPRAAFYQRLAARDQDEAVDIVEKELAKRPAVEVLDDVLLPVLATARQDAAEGRLSDDDLRFLTAAVRDVGEDLTEIKPGGVPSGEAPVRVIILPAKDAVDHVAADLFGRLLDPAFWEVEVAPANTLASELLERVKKVDPAIAVVVSLPPGGLTHARYLCKRLRAQAGDLKIVVGRWAAPEDDGAGWANLKSCGASELTGSLDATKAFLSGWRAVLAPGPTPAKPAEASRGPRSLLGTASA